jgi:hypothetical protein
LGDLSSIFDMPTLEAKEEELIDSVINAERRVYM